MISKLEQSFTCVARLEDKEEEEINKSSDDRNCLTRTPYVDKIYVYYFKNKHKSECLG